MNYYATKSTTYVKKLILNQSHAVVHSVYRKTINVVTGESLFAIQAEDSHLSPVSIISSMTGEEMSQLFVVPGMEVLITPKLMIFPTFVLSLEDTVYENMRLRLISEKDLIPALKKEIAGAILHSGSGGLDVVFHSCLDTGDVRFIPCPGEGEVEWNIFQKAAAVRLQHAYDLFWQGSFSDSAKELIHLIGLGTGLTPCGDDFICGIFAGFQLLDEWKHPFISSLRPLVADHLSDTNIISSTFLKCSMDGQFSAAVNALAEDGIVETEITRLFKEIGHSSGFDSLCGIYFAMMLL